MSENYDRALDALSHPTQRSDDQGYGRQAFEYCWRCGRLAETAIGACGPCAAWLRGDTDDDPAEAPRIQPWQWGIISRADLYDGMGLPGDATDRARGGICDLFDTMYVVLIDNTQRRNQ